MENRSHVIKVVCKLYNVSVVRSSCNQSPFLEVMLQVLVSVGRESKGEKCL